MVARHPTPGGVRRHLFHGRGRVVRVRDGGIARATSKHSAANREAIVLLLVSGLVATAILAIGFLAPRESTMGEPSGSSTSTWPSPGLVWSASSAGQGGAALSGAARACVGSVGPGVAEVGWLCAGLTLVTGSLWAHAAWGTWWTWEPRLTTAFILWCMYSGYLIARNNIENTLIAGPGSPPCWPSSVRWTCRWSPWPHACFAACIPCRPGHGTLHAHGYCG